MTTVLIVAAHPDDEVLGCGGTAARHVAAGDRVEILILGEGATSRFAAGAGAARPEVEHLYEAARSSAVTIGAEAPRFGDFPDNRLDTIPTLDLVKCIESIVAEVAPTCVYTHHGGDLNIDHRLVCNAVITGCRPLPGSTVDSVFCFETPSSTEWADPREADFRPNHFVDVSQFMEKKINALRAYDVEMRDFPHPRSYDAVRTLARWRGASVGLEAAEAFMTIRRIVR